MKVGDKIRIIRMDGEPQYDGKIGYVEHIDDAGQIHGTWGGCALIPGVDEYKVIKNDDVKALGLALGAYGIIYLIISIVEQIWGVAI